MKYLKLATRAYAARIVCVNALALMASAFAQVPVFEDSFTNGIPANSDQEPGIWSVALQFNSSQAEAAGKLTQTATATGTELVAVTATTPVQSRFNFFDRKIRIGASLSVAGTTSQGWMSRGRLLLSSVAGSANFSPDVISVGFRNQQNVSLTTKLDAPYVEPDNVSNSLVTARIGTSSDPTVAYSGSDRADSFDLILDKSRFRLTARNGGKGSGLLRFTGNHGLNRAQWGSNGDSALVLESVRTAGGAGSSTTSIWDDIAVATDATPLLAEPYWDFQSIYATNTTGTATKTGDFRLWLPSTEPVIRGIIFIGPGSGEDFRYFVHDPVAQEAARAMGFGLIGYTNAANMNFWTENPSLIRAAVQGVLDRAANVSGRPEISNAPLCITGLSAGGFDSTFLARYWPERTIAFVAHRGAGYFSVISLSSAAKKVPGFLVAGSTDTNNFTNPFVLKQRFTAWRSLGGQIAFAVDWGVGHTIRGNQGWEATFAWLAEVAGLRYPRPMLPSLEMGAGGPSLINLAERSGWLGETVSFSAAATPTVTHAFTRISPYSSYTVGAPSEASWLANETCAKIYRALSSTDLVPRTVIPLQGPLRIVSPAQYADPVQIGQPLTISLDPREAGDSSALVSVDFYDGDTLIGQDTVGPEWSITFTPSQAGLLPLTMVSTDASGNQRAALRTLFTSPAAFAPVARPARSTVTSNAPTTGMLSGWEPEGNPVAFQQVSAPSHGLLEIDSTTGNYIYKPIYGFSGADSFSFSIQTMAGASVEAIVLLEVQPLRDSDSDGLPDTWEAAHGLTMAGEDSDGDGFSNLQEYHSYTDPNDPGDFLHIVSISETESPLQFQFHWKAVGGVRYRVQYSDDLLRFFDITRPVAAEVQPGGYGEPGLATFTDDFSLTSPRIGGRRFYRVTTLRE